MELTNLNTNYQSILSSQVNKIEQLIQKEINYDNQLYEQVLDKIEFYYTQNGIQYQALGINLDVTV